MQVLNTDFLKLRIFEIFDFHSCKGTIVNQSHTGDQFKSLGPLVHYKGLLVELFEILQL